MRNFFQSPKGAVRKQRAERAEAKHLVGKSNLVKRFSPPFLQDFKIQIQVTVADPIKLFFLRFPIFAVKLEC